MDVPGGESVHTLTMSEGEEEDKEESAAPAAAGAAAPAAAGAAAPAAAGGDGVAAPAVSND